MSSEPTAPEEALPSLTDADKRLISFLVKLAIRKAVRECSSGVTASQPTPDTPTESGATPASRTSSAAPEASPATT